jgi:hypothetical protein
MPRRGFELPILPFERAKTVHALDRAATVVGIYIKYGMQSSVLLQSYWSNHNLLRALI